MEKIKPGDLVMIHEAKPNSPFGVVKNGIGLVVGMLEISKGPMPYAFVQWPHDSQWWNVSKLEKVS
jgi:hypothetical protein|tara:strand:+ start:7302 stop:7499 length:198 start_codon:yes stop_codon:yes gene_type:complete